VSYRVLFSPHSIRAYRNRAEEAKKQVDGAVEEILRNPFHGPNIKQLKGPLRDYRRCRAGNYRILYAVSKHSKEVFLDYIQDRKDSYK